MRLTTKARFAVAAILDLAINQDNGLVTLASISQRKNISLSYLEQIFFKLKKNGIVKSRRGPGGGYFLKEKLENIKIASIIVAVDESIDSTICNGKGECEHTENKEEYCSTHKLWEALNMHIKDFLLSISIQDLINNFNNKENKLQTISLYKKDEKNKKNNSKNVVQSTKLNHKISTLNSVFSLGQQIIGDEKDE